MQIVRSVSVGGRTEMTFVFSLLSFLKMKKEANEITILSVCLFLINF
jgi:hypothetical protein